MRAIRDFDAELKAINDKLRQLKERRIRQLGELVIACGADTLSADELAGALLMLAETAEAGKREVWAKRGEAFFRARARKPRARTQDDSAGDAANDSTAQPAQGRQSAN